MGYSNFQSGVMANKFLWAYLTHNITIVNNWKYTNIISHAHYKMTKLENQASLGDCVFLIKRAANNSKHRLLIEVVENANITSALTNILCYNRNVGNKWNSERNDENENQNRTTENHQSG